MFLLTTLCTQDRNAKAQFSRTSSSDTCESKATAEASSCHARCKQSQKKQSCTIAPFPYKYDNSNSNIARLGPALQIGDLDFRFVTPFMMASNNVQGQQTHCRKHHTPPGTLRSPKQPSPKKFLVWQDAFRLCRQFSCLFNLPRQRIGSRTVSSGKSRIWGLVAV